MKRLFILMGVAGSLLALGSGSAIASSAPFHSPDTIQAYEARAVLEQDARALEAYVDLCALHDRGRLTQLITHDLAVEYQFAGGGLRPVLELTAHAHPCAGARALTAFGHLSDLWVFPTDTADEVLVEFSPRALGRRDGAFSNRLAILVMHRGRIARLRILVPASSLTPERGRLLADRRSAH